MKKKTIWIYMNLQMGIKVELYRLPSLLRKRNPSSAGGSRLKSICKEGGGMGERVPGRRGKNEILPSGVLLSFSS